MSTVSANDLYIVVTYSRWDGVSGDTDRLYTDKAEAEKEAASTNAIWEKNNSSLKSSVITLSDYIDDVKRDEYLRGQDAERCRDSY